MLTQPGLVQLQAAEARAACLEQCPAQRSIVSRQEARIRDLESQLDFQAVQMKRFEVPTSSPLAEGMRSPGEMQLACRKRAQPGRVGRGEWGLWPALRCLRTAHVVHAAPLSRHLSDRHPSASSRSQLSRLGHNVSLSPLTGIRLSLLLLLPKPRCPNEPSPGAKENDLVPPKQQPAPWEPQGTGVALGDGAACCGGCRAGCCRGLHPLHAAAATCKALG